MGSSQRTRSAAVLAGFTAFLGIIGSVVTNLLTSNPAILRWTEENPRFLILISVVIFVGIILLAIRTTVVQSSEDSNGQNDYVSQNSSLNGRFTKGFTDTRPTTSVKESTVVVRPVELTLSVAFLIFDLAYKYSEKLVIITGNSSIINISISFIISVCIYFLLIFLGFIVKCYIYKITVHSFVYRRNKTENITYKSLSESIVQSCIWTPILLFSFYSIFTLIRFLILHRISSVDLLSLYNVLVFLILMGVFVGIFLWSTNRKLNLFEDNIKYLSKNVRLFSFLQFMTAPLFIVSSLARFPLEVRESINIFFPQDPEIVSITDAKYGYCIQTKDITFGGGNIFFIEDNVFPEWIAKEVDSLSTWEAYGCSSATDVYVSSAREIFPDFRLGSDDSFTVTNTRYGNGIEITIKEEDLYIPSGAGISEENIIFEADYLFDLSRPTGYSGLIVRASDSNEYMLFDIDNNGMYRIRKRENNNWTEVKESTFIGNIFRKNESNRIGLYVMNGEYSLLVNNHRITNIIDNDYQEGDIALVAGTASSVGVSVSFSNTRVVILD